MDEEIIIDQECIEEAKAQMAKDPALRPCKLCYHYDSEKNWCSFIKKPRMQYNYGAACFLTSEQAVRAMILQDRKRAKTLQKKFYGKMDVMNIMVSGADMIRVDLLNFIEAEYKRLDIKAKSDDATYARNKRNFARLEKCYKQMKVSLQDFESSYRTFIDYWNDQSFADEKGNYSPEFDKHQHNIGYCTWIFFGIFEKLVSEENIEKFIEFMNTLEGKDIWEESDLKRYLIKI